MATPPNPLITHPHCVLVVGSNTQRVRVWAENERGILWSGVPNRRAGRHPSHPRVRVDLTPYAQSRTKNKIERESRAISALQLEIRRCRCLGIPVPKKIGTKLEKLFRSREEVNRRQHAEIALLFLPKPPKDRKARLEKKPSQGRRRWLREQNAIGTHTNEEWLGVLAAFGSRCLRCGSSEKLVKDHIRPMYLGGSNEISNLQPLCSRCNTWKGLKVIDFRPEEMVTDE